MNGTEEFCCQTSHVSLKAETRNPSVTFFKYRSFSASDREPVAAYHAPRVSGGGEARSISVPFQSYHCLSNEREDFCCLSKSLVSQDEVKPDSPQFRTVPFQSIDQSSDELTALCYTSCNCTYTALFDMPSSTSYAISRSSDHPMKCLIKHMIGICVVLQRLRSSGCHQAASSLHDALSSSICLSD